MCVYIVIQTILFWFIYKLSNILVFHIVGKIFQNKKWSVVGVLEVGSFWNKGYGPLRKLRLSLSSCVFTLIIVFIQRFIVCHFCSLLSITRIMFSSFTFFPNYLNKYTQPICRTYQCMCSVLSTYPQ